MEAAAHGDGTASGTMRQLKAYRVAAAIAGLAAVGLVACASSRSSAGSAGSSCGTTRTGANVPVVIKVVRGNVDCGTVMRVEDSYATMIKDGKVPGNGGGAPVSVNGWVCEGYPTPQVLRTGDASQCHTTSAEVVAVLASPSPGRPPGRPPAAIASPSASRPPPHSSMPSADSSPPAGGRTALSPRLVLIICTWSLPDAFARYSAASAAASSSVSSRRDPASRAATPIDTVTGTRSDPAAPLA